MKTSKMETSQVKEDFIKNRNRTQYLINSANIIDNADGQMLPAVYLTLERTLGFTPTENGIITAIRSLLQSISAPFWGWFSDRHSRKNILSFGCAFWGVFTFLMALGNNYVSILFFRALTGLGLAVIVPTAQSLIADYFEDNERGKAFGWLGLTGVLGAIIGTLYATAIADTQIFGVDGWRVAFMTIATLSFLLGLAILKFAKDPIRGSSEDELKGLVDEKVEARYKITTRDYKKILGNKTFILIALQGVAGLIPWNSILFVIQWFEYIGFDPIVAGLSFAIIAVGAALGNLFGGWVGDKAARWDYNKGRPLVAQISIFSGIPLMFVIFWLLPRRADIIGMVLFIAFGFFTGFMISWVAPASNNPIFSEIFEPEIRSSAYSIQRLFEGSTAATGTLIVGFLAEAFFGYITPKRGLSINEIPEAIRIANINALANAMLVATVIPWIFCLIIYTFVYLTYPKDRERLRHVLIQRQKELLSKNKE